MPLKPPPAAQSAARRTIEKAFKDLERTIAPTESRDFSSTTLDDVRKAAIEVERQLAARQSLRNTRRLEPLFKGLEHYAKVIDALANGTDYLPWIWAPIKLILKIAADYVEAFERIIKAYAQIADALQRFQLLERSFQGKPELYATFAVFYADILTFHKAAYKFVTRPCWKLLFLTAWGRFQREFDGILVDLTKNGELIDKEANAHNIVEARKMRQDLDSWRAESVANLAQTQREQTARQIQGLITWLRFDDSDQLALVDSLTEVGANHPGTVDWVLKKSQMAAWLRPTTESRFLWLHGGPGIGKSVMVAQLISFLAKSKKSLVVHHFCSQTHDASKQYDQVIKALLLQCVQGDGDLVNYIYEEYVGSKSASVALLEKLLETAIEALSNGPNRQGYEAIHILIDGLEECTYDNQKRLIRGLERLMSAGASCKVLVSSRDSPDAYIKKKRPAVLWMADEKANLTDAITKFAITELEEMQEKLDQLGISEHEKSRIASGISTRADGMFLWARLVLNYLSANIFYDGEEFSRAASTLPRELSEFYDKLLSRIIAGLDSQSIMRIKLIFGWIGFAKHPLQKAELQSALLFHQDNVISSKSSPVPLYVLDKCKPLVNERRDSTLGFIHISVKEFLEQHVFDKSIQLDPRQILFENGMASLRCIREAFDLFNASNPQTQRDLQISRGVWGFIPYATEFWCVMLRDIATLPEAEWDPRFTAIAMSVSTMLEASRPDHRKEPPEPRLKGLESIRRFPSLCYDINVGLQARAIGRSRPVDVEDQERHPLQQPKFVHNIFPLYESTTQHLLSIYEHHELTRSELDAFREKFSGHAFICRFSSCPRACSGFMSQKERLHHETAHSPAFPCLQPRCQYPPFGSKAALQRHHSEAHKKCQPRPRLVRSAPKPRRQPSPKPAIPTELTSPSEMPPKEASPSFYYASMSKFQLNMSQITGEPTILSQYHFTTKEQTPVTNNHPLLPSPNQMFSQYNPPLVVDTKAAEAYVDDDERVSILYTNYTDQSLLDSGFDFSGPITESKSNFFGISVSPKAEDWRSVEMQYNPSNNPFIDRRRNNPFLRIDQSQQPAYQSHTTPMTNSGSAAPLPVYDHLRLPKLSSLLSSPDTVQSSPYFPRYEETSAGTG